MSFYQITDPKKRDAMVADYVSTMKRLHGRELQDRLQDFEYQQNQEKLYRPLIKSNAETNSMIKKIVDEKKIKNEPKESVKDEFKESEIKSNSEKKSNTFFDNLRDKILAKDPDVDNTYGIYFTPEGKTYMGSSPITVQNDDIVVGSQVYDGTEGLWRLIVGVKETQIGKIGEDFTNDDLKQYVRLLRQTNVLYRDFNPKNGRPRASKSYKWRIILKPLWNSFREDSEEEEGGGIKFLPGSIKGLKEKLNLLIGEYKAGNTTTINELVAVLDQLRDRKAISEREYESINSLL